MLIAKLFLPMASPGLGMVGLGLVGLAKGTYDFVEVAAIVLGLLVVAIAGIFTIRSNVAKIWREQAEGEKARNAEMSIEIAGLREQVAELQKALAVANARTNLDELKLQVKEQHLAVLARLDVIDTHLEGPNAYRTSAP